MMTDAELNRAVAEACGLNIRSIQPIIDDPRAHARTFVGDLFEEFDPLNSWSDCGPLIARFGLEVTMTTLDHGGTAAWEVSEPRRLAGICIDWGDDPDAALRRAICLAVVEVSK